MTAGCLISAYLIFVWLLGYRRNEVPLSLSAAFLGMPLLATLSLTPHLLLSDHPTPDTGAAFGYQVLIWAVMACPASAYGSRRPWIFALAGASPIILIVLGVGALLLAGLTADPIARAQYATLAVIELQWAVRDWYARRR